jgi:protein MpaA
MGIGWPGSGPAGGNIASVKRSRGIPRYEFELGEREFAFRRSFTRDVLQPLKSVEGYEPTILSRLRYGSYEYPLLLMAPRLVVHGGANVLISAGVHGDEPAGVYAAVDLLRAGITSQAERVNTYVLPCVNPSGFEVDTLETMIGGNLNRSFHLETALAENREILNWLDRAGIAFDLAMDLHEIVPNYVGEGFVEADNPRGCYLYEWREEREGRIGRKLLAAVKPKTGICNWSTIYQDVSDRGLISYPEGERNPVYALRTTFDAYLISRHAKHTFTTETPTVWPLEKRIRVQSAWVRRAIEHYVGRGTRG